MNYEDSIAFWDKLAHMINTYMASLEKNGINRLWIDDIIEPQIVKINEHEKRIVASSYTSEDGGKSFVNYKISIETKADTLELFIETNPILEWQDLEGIINIIPEKKRVTINAT